MGGFTVDTAALHGLSHQVGDMVAELRETTAADAPSDAELGGADLGDAVRTFEDHWRDGCQRLLDRLVSLQSLVMKAAVGYEQTDTGIGNAATGQGTTGGGAP